MRRRILILAIGFLPNIGGLETHLKDLIEELVDRKWEVVVLTYQPLNTPVLGKWIEKEKGLTVIRLPIIRGIFYRLLKNPLFEFIFLEPLLFLFTPIILLLNPKIDVVNAQGVIAGFSASFWARVFRKRYVISAQSVYSFPKEGLFRLVCRWIFRSADKVIAISRQSKEEIEDLGVTTDKIQLYTNWENSDFFKPRDKVESKKIIGLAGKFVVSFFGRLIEEKGVKVVIEAIKLTDKKITFAIYGEGPLVNFVKEAAQKYSNVYYMGTVDPKLLPLHYSAADLVLMPTLNDEGFGRVAAGALFCGTPVIASNRGALPEVVNSSVGKIINPTAVEIAKTVNLFFHDRKLLGKLAAKARPHALEKFTRKNAENIINSYI